MAKPPPPACHGPPLASTRRQEKAADAPSIFPLPPGRFPLRPRHFRTRPKPSRSTTVANTWPASSYAASTLSNARRVVTSLGPFLQSSRGAPGVVAPFTRSPPAAESFELEFLRLRPLSVLAELFKTLRVSSSPSWPISRNFPCPGTPWPSSSPSASARTSSSAWTPASR